MARDLLAGISIPSNSTGRDLLFTKTPPIKQQTGNIPNQVLQKPSLPLQFGTNLLTSYAKAAQGMGEAIANPLQTAATIGALGIGAVQSAVGSPIGQAIGWHDERPLFNKAKKQILLDHYGSWDKFKTFAISDPIQAALDVGTVLSGSGKALQLAGKIPKLSALAKIGEVTSAIGESRPFKYVNPATPIQSLLTKPIRSLAPYSQDVNPEVLALKNKYGMDLPASAISDNPEVADIEGIIARGKYSKRIMGKYEAAQDQLKGIVNDTIKKTGMTDDASIAGQTFAEGLKKYDTQFVETKNNLYQEATLPKLSLKPGEPALHPINVRPDKTVALLDELIENEKLVGAGTKQTTPAYKKYKALRDSLARKKSVDPTVIYGRISAKEIQAKLRDWNEGTISNEFRSFGKEAEAKKIAATMADDMENAIKEQQPDLAQKLEDAKEFYKQGRQILESQWARNVQKLAKQGNYSKIIPVVFNKNTSIEDLAKIAVNFDQDTLTQVQSAFLGDMMKKAINNDGNFRPEALRNIIRDYGEDKLNLILTPEQFQTVKDVSVLAKALGKTPRALTGAQTNFMEAVRGKFFNFTSPIQSIARVLSQNTAQRFFASDIGQKLLTTGYEPAGKIGRILNAPILGYSAEQIGRTTQIDKNRK